ncbi:DUF3073 domain-containing protein [uncultured Bifidobacterium sp.]|uniref:DUF3073 domain-containing protein n=1 Tax=uncultured Bifidobacterium sp. TaxID=165187 RepID=UPI0028DB205D|nr:DUF3073 domain-containing protein [uncultured Bifidobacterium sp.]
MGRGRQKAKQQKIARKLKYLTTDTDYDELAKELSSQEPGTESPDSAADVADGHGSVGSLAATSREPDAPVEADELDDYARWAAQAAAKATGDETPDVGSKGSSSASAAQPPALRARQRIPMPVPSMLRKPSPHRSAA